MRKRAMCRTVLVGWVGLGLLGALCSVAEEPMSRLPDPEYQPQRSDPPWLRYAAQFHGHLGPWATAGTRLGMAARRAVAARGYFDIRVVCRGPFQRPPRSCFLDGLQVATGATWGKRNLQWTEADQIVVIAENMRNGRRVEIRPAPQLLQLLESLASPPSGPGRGHDEAQRLKLEAMARRIARMPDEELFVQSPAGGRAERQRQGRGER